VLDLIDNIDYRIGLSQWFEMSIIAHIGFPQHRVYHCTEFHYDRATMEVVAGVLRIDLLVLLLCLTSLVMPNMTRASNRVFGGGRRTNAVVARTALE
jgi:hypothetical protein